MNFFILKKKDRFWIKILFPISLIFEDALNKQEGGGIVEEKYRSEKKWGDKI